MAWSFRGFRHEPLFNLVDHPLLVRLKMTPGYLVRRNRAVYELLVGEASVPNVRRRADRLFTEMAPYLAAEPYWDAYKLLPRVTRFHRFMVRPMSTAKWLLAARAEIHGYGRRVHFLLDALERPSTTATAYAVSPTLTRVDLVQDGHGAQRLRQVTVTGACSGEHTWRADTDRDGRIGRFDPVVATAPLATSSGVVEAYADLLPGVRLVPRHDPQPKLGSVRTEPEPRAYTYLLTSPCAPDDIVLVLDNLVTGTSSRLSPSVRPDVVPVPVTALPSPGSVPAFTAGTRSSHLWDFASEPAAAVVRLGPGLVRVTGTRIYAQHQQVSIAAGTRVEMGPGANLVFRGPVSWAGTSRAPVVISAAHDERPFGGIAIQGPATAGSSLSHFRIEGGTRIGYGDILYPSLLNVYDTRDITIESGRFTATTAADDVVHAAYVRGIRLNEIEIVQAPTDAVDLEFSEGELRGVRVFGAGDDCLDFMGSDVRVADSLLIGCGGNAVSAGEETDVTAHGLFISHSGTGLLAKNASHARLTRSLVYRTTTALETKRRDIHYTGVSSIGASDLFVVDCESTASPAADSRITTEQVRRALPSGSALEHLAQHVLGLKAWDGLDRHIARLRGGV